MLEFNKKGMRIILLMAIVFMLFANIAYARTIAEVFGNALAEIGNFFELTQYEPYSNAIDFFLFSILFVSLYMAGARNVFKEFKRPEKIIVVLLGLVTAFLLVVAGFSITLLLPYVHWILFLLLFLFLLWLFKGIEQKPWRFILASALALLPLALLQGYCEINWLLYLIIFVILLFLLKGIKNRFGRFIVALIITAIIFFLLQFVCGYFGLPDITGIGEKAPETKGIVSGAGSYFSSLWQNIKSIQFNIAPGIPNWLRAGPTELSAPRLQVVHPQPQQTTAPSTEAPPTGKQLEPEKPTTPSTPPQTTAPPATTAPPSTTPPAVTAPAPAVPPASAESQFQIIRSGKIIGNDVRVGDILFTEVGNRRIRQITPKGEQHILTYDDGGVNILSPGGVLNHNGIIRGANVDPNTRQSPYVTIGINRYRVRDSDGDGRYNLERYGFFRNDMVTDPNTDTQLQSDLKTQSNKPISKTINLEDVEVSTAGLSEDIEDIFRANPVMTLLIVLGIILAFRYRKKIIPKLKVWKRGRIQREEISDFYREKREIDRLANFIEASNKAISEMSHRNKAKNYFLKDATKHASYIDALTKEGTDRPMIFYPEGREALRKEHKDISNLLDEEFRFLDALNQLKETELQLLKQVREISKRGPK